MQVQAELVRRRVVHVSPTGKKRSFSCNHCFAQMVFCGDCGELYRRVHWNNHGCKSIVWRCISRLEPTSAEKNCTNRTVNELLLQEITVKAFNQILTEQDFFLKALQQNITKAVVGADILSPDGIQARLVELQKELIKKANNKQDYEFATKTCRVRCAEKRYVGFCIVCRFCRSGLFPAVFLFQIFDILIAPLFNAIQNRAELLTNFRE